MNRLLLSSILQILFLFAGCVDAWSQETVRDTLMSSLAIGERTRLSENHVFTPIQIREKITFSGEPDVSRIVHRVAGVSEGADGSAGFFVRGGNNGNNLISLDGVPIYGSNHLLGMISCIPSDAVSSIKFKTGGFTAEDRNFTSSNMSLSTKSGDYARFHAGASISNFLVDATSDGPIVKNKLSYSISARWSPLQYEYDLFRNLAHADSDVQVSFHDVLGKLSWKPGSKNEVSGFVFHSGDRYGYSIIDNTDNSLYWGNDAGGVNWYYYPRKSMALKSCLGVTRFVSGQGQSVLFGNSLNTMHVENLITEYSIDEFFEWRVNEYLALATDSNVRYATFNPGSSYLYSGSANYSPQNNQYSGYGFNVVLPSVSGQVKYERGSVLMQLNTRISAYMNLTESTRYISPDVNAVFRYNLSERFGVEANFDLMSQYYHSLEGLPVGWSVDMLIPSTKDIAPEKAGQGHLAVDYSKDGHGVSAGLYYKRMQNLVFFADSRDLFKTPVSRWEDNIHVGEGASMGLEATYSFVSESLQFNLAYTLSKTDRCFPGINEGQRFPAKFDRRHVLNSNLEIPLRNTSDLEYGFNMFFTFQSGNWETMADGSYSFPLLDGERVDVKHYGDIHNVKMKDICRTDIGFYFNIKGRRFAQDMNVGIFNLFNRHNPFMAVYDTADNEWKQLSIMPIMPNFNYRIYF